MPAPIHHLQNDEMAEHLKTQNSVEVAIDEAGRNAQGTVQWLLENRTEIPITYGNALKFLICGQEGFQSLAKDLREAQATADIVCWGFDPGMELVRAGGKWKRGQTYGELLDEITTRPNNPVRVRLLIWGGFVASVVQDNMPGLTDPWGSPYESRARDEYSQRWWRDNLPSYRGFRGKNPNLQIVLRTIARADVVASLAAMPKEEDEPVDDWHNPVDEGSLLKNFATHHQKPVLIDYAYEGGRKAVGYVMGLNSVTDYWDRAAHEIDDPLREARAEKAIGAERTHESATQGVAANATYRRTKPYQDYACRVVGPALKRLHENFERGWNAFAPRTQKTEELTQLPPNIPTLPRNPAHSVQIVRTQPQEREKSIKELYFQATSFARNYIYIENQYFFYPEFARHLKKERAKFCDAWARLPDKPISEVPKLHLFIVIPHPEDDGLVPRTFDALTELGASDTMREQAAYIDAGKHHQDYAHAHKGTKGNMVIDRPSLEELQGSLGLKVSVARLRTSGLDANHKMAYREIYIHSKLMLIDDVFVTLGSANVNQRSMAVDSEINIAATGQAAVSELRQRVFTLHSGGSVLGSGNRSEMSRVFENWSRQMGANRLSMKSGGNMEGFLLPFEDHRATSTMHA
ncbi:phospholipase D-like domain-containing protein [Trinickia sp.]|uniref:phospholipase D-like domain-containing protein n=1 Tax=Trinickia sp. TaxID=2571163 RepID=UPI003F7EDEBA